MHKAIIKGTIKTETIYGPPGYGKSPELDEKKKTNLLLLEYPILIITDLDTIKNIYELRLTNSSQEKIGNFKEKVVLINGEITSVPTSSNNSKPTLEIAQIEEL